VITDGWASNCCSAYEAVTLGASRASVANSAIMLILFTACLFVLVGPQLLCPRGPPSSTTLSRAFWREGARVQYPIVTRGKKHAILDSSGKVVVPKTQAPRQYFQTPMKGLANVNWPATKAAGAVNYSQWMAFNGPGYY
jgi:hypothetical protein